MLLGSGWGGLAFKCPVLLFYLSSYELTCKIAPKKCEFLLSVCISMEAPLRYRLPWTVTLIDSFWSLHDSNIGKSVAMMSLFISLSIIGHNEYFFACFLFSSEMFYR